MTNWVMLHVGSNKVRLGAIKTARHSVTSYGASSALLFVCLRLFASVSVLLPSTHSHCWSICPDLRSGCPIRVSPFQCNLCLCILLHSSLRVSVPISLSVWLFVWESVSFYLSVYVLSYLRYFYLQSTVSVTAVSIHVSVICLTCQGLSFYFVPRVTIFQKANLTSCIPALCETQQCTESRRPGIQVSAES